MGSRTHSSQIDGFSRTHANGATVETEIRKYENMRQMCSKIAHWMTFQNGQTNNPKGDIGDAHKGGYIINMSNLLIFTMINNVPNIFVVWCTVMLNGY